MLIHGRGVCFGSGWFLGSLPRGNLSGTLHRIADDPIAQMRVLAFSMLAFLMLALSPASALKVLVTGAGGRTGHCVDR